jgi:ElaB/YqjD/DUF883 family membrane-anchored ribosome-binding protein
MGAAGNVVPVRRKCAGQIEGDVDSRIKKNPWSAVAIAGLIGLLIGKMN